MAELVWLDPRDVKSHFPPVDQAMREPNGLLAAGGDLSMPRLLRAYRNGIFPWYEPGQPILWWSPEPRAVLFPTEFRMHRSLRKALRNRGWHYSFDQLFPEVVHACALPRDYTDRTWITPEMQSAYLRLFKAGHAHSVEVWDEGHRLVGGLYGVAIGKVFFGESMFSRQRDASKAALAVLARQLQVWGYKLIDCQMESTHLESLGSRNIPREEFVRLLHEWCYLPGQAAPWRVDENLDISHWQPGERASPDTNPPA
jgi:leucyl/phenylalanyl-tRNA--protein transferase